MRVLILAEDCNPEWPSLPVVGYKFAKAIADRVEVKDHQLSRSWDRSRTL
jgi:hypothetical protein